MFTDIHLLKKTRLRNGGSVDKKQPHFKVHFTHKWRMKRLYLQGFTVQEIAIAYKVPIWYVNGLTQRLKKPERI